MKITLLIALIPFLPASAAEPWNIEPTPAQLAELRKLVKELGGRSHHWTGVESIELASADLDELPPLRFRCGVALFANATDADLKRFARHPGIVSLALVNSKVTDAGLKELSKLKGISRLDVSQSRITDAGLIEIAKLPALKQLSLIGTPTTDGGLRNLSGLKLTKLELPQHARTNLGLKHYLNAVASFESLESHYDWPGVTDEGLAVLEGRESLKRLTWWSDKKMGLVMRRILPTLKGLHDIHLEGAGVGDDDLRLIAMLPNVHKLNISSNPITNAGIKHLVGMKSLSVLYLSSTQITDDGLQVLARTSSLESLNLIGTSITDRGMEHLAALPRLQALDLRETRITEGGLIPFRGKKLSAVTTSKPFESEETFLILAPNLPSQDEAMLGQWKLTDRGLSEVAKRKSLTKLLVSGNFSEQGFARIGELTELHTLEIILEKPIPASAFRHLTKLKRLEHLGLRGDITDEALAEISQLQSLTSFAVNSGSMTAQGVKSISKLKNLSRLSMGLLPEEGAKALATLSRLSYLELSSLPEESAKALAKSPSLTTLDLRNAEFRDKALMALADLKTLQWIDITFADLTDAGRIQFKRLHPKCELYHGE